MRLRMLPEPNNLEVIIMGAISTVEASPAFIFLIPIPEPLLERVVKWFEKNANLGGMALVQGEARFCEAHWADAFAEEVGADWHE